MEVLRRNGLGRTQPVGDLYDARTDSFTGDSILSSSSTLSQPPGILEENQLNFTEFTSKQNSHNLGDRYDQLELKGELKLSVLCGLVDVSGNFFLLLLNFKIQAKPK